MSRLAYGIIFLAIVSKTRNMWRGNSWSRCVIFQLANFLLNIHSLPSTSDRWFDTVLGNIFLNYSTQFYSITVSFSNRWFALFLLSMLSFFIKSLPLQFQFLYFWHCTWIKVSVYAATKISFLHQNIYIKRIFSVLWSGFQQLSS